MTQEKIKAEIAIHLDMMRTAGETQREYLIGALSVLLWVQGGGEAMRSTCFVQACEAWDKMREEVSHDAR